MVTATTGRRSILRAAAAVALAGATGAGNTTAGVASATPVQNGEVPDYADWYPDDDYFLEQWDELAIGSLEVDAMLELAAFDEGEVEAYLGADPVPVPLQLEPSALTTVVAAFTVSQDLVPLGLDEPLLGQPANRALADPRTTDAPADRFAFFDYVSVFTGSFDADAVESAVTLAGFQPSDRDGVSVDRETGRALSWSEDHFVLGETVEEVGMVLDAGRGDATSRHETDDDFARLLSAGGHGQFTFTARSTADPLSADRVNEEFVEVHYAPFQGAQGYAQSNDWTVPDPDADAAVDPEETVVEARTTVGYATEDRVDRDRLSAIGERASDRTATSDGRFVTVESAYSSADVADLHVPFVRGRTNSTDGRNATERENEPIDGEDGSIDADDRRESDGGDDAEADEQATDSAESTEDEVPGFGATAAVASLGGLTSLLRRRLGDDSDVE